MTAGAQTTGLALLLGLGAIDLAALNLWVLPPLLMPAGAVASRDETQTAVLAASEHEQQQEQPVPAPTSLARSVKADGETNTGAGTSTGTGMKELRTREPVRGEGPTAVRADRAARRAVVRFRKGTWWIGVNERDQILRLAGTAVGAGASFEIDGYADESGPDELNQRISRARADAIAELLVRAGIDRGRIALRAHGELPVMRGDGSDERRAELRVLREGSQ